jgi:MoaA/NifB/PqqE/SkfB family radical SAM enzyme
MLAWDHWHIEPSSICTLRCPRCPRAEVADSLINQQLNLQFFQNQIGANIIQKIKKITFCGNDGDPIYCKDFIEICQWIKQVNPKIQLVIITNGSYKTFAWWKQLAEVLDENDEVNWSLDGWDQTSNEQYRVNSSWASIEQGIRTFFSYNQTSYRVWAAIAFRFNQNFISYQKNLAFSLGFDCFQLTKSTKFGSKYPSAYGQEDLLEPTDTTLVASGHRFERVLHQNTNKARPGNNLKKIYFQRAEYLDKNTPYSGICLIGNKGVFLNSRGEFYPCCWTATRYSHNSKWHQQAEDNFNLNNRTFQEIIEDPFWQQEFLKFDSLECTSKCTKEKLSDLEHTTEW